MVKINDSFQENFINNLVKKAGFDEESGILIKEDLRPLIQQRIVLCIYDEIGPENTEIAGEYFKNGDFENFDKFVRTIIPNFEDFMYEIYAQFEDEYLEKFKK